MIVFYLFEYAAIKIHVWSFSALAMKLGVPNHPLGVVKVPFQFLEKLNWVPIFQFSFRICCILKYITFFFKFETKLARLF